MPVKSQEPIGPCEVSLEIEVEPIKVADAVDKAYREFSKYVAVPGFRRGKAPLAFVKPRVPDEQLRERTVELLTGPAYEEALAQSKLVPFTHPRMEMVKLQTSAPEYVFEFKAIVPLAPTVTLGKYIGLEAQRERPQVTDADVDARIEYLRSNATAYPSADDRPAKLGDVVEGELSLEFDELGSPGAFERTAITIGDPGNLEGIDDALIGVSLGDEKSFDVTYPADFPNPETAGKSAHATVRVKKLYERIVPEINAEFAKQLGSDTVDELRKEQKSELERRSLAAAENVVETKLIDAVMAETKVDYPPVLAENELKSDISEFLKTLEMRETSIEDYLAHNGQTEEELMAAMRERIDSRLRRGLALGEIAKAEKIEVTDGDVNAEIKERADAQRTTVQAVRAYIDRTSSIEEVRNRLLVKKIIDFIKAAAKITDKVVEAGAARNKAAAGGSKSAPKVKKTSKKKEAAPDAAV